MPGYPRNWEDMSNYLVHFTRGGDRSEDYRTMLSIYRRRRLIPGAEVGIGRRVAPDLSSQRAICFSEIPPGQWHRLSERHQTRYGIGFRKQFVVNKGGGPIWYVYNKTPQWQSLQQIMQESQGEPAAPIWKLTPLIDAPGEYSGRRYYFEWEREWRYVGQFSFEIDDVAFLLIPEELHQAARTFFEDVCRENIGPAYFCPYVDPTWERDRILETLQR